MNNTKIAIMFESHGASGKADGRRRVTDWWKDGCYFAAETASTGRGDGLRRAAGDPAVCLRCPQTADHMLLRLAWVRDARQVPCDTDCTNRSGAETMAIHTEDLEYHRPAGVPL